jgi:hypothetical protein
MDDEELQEEKSFNVSSEDDTDFDDELLDLPDEPADIEDPDLAKEKKEEDEDYDPDNRFT